MDKQKCFDCGAEFVGKPWIDTCPVCRSNHIIHQEPIEFVNLGDVNFLAYGGNLVFRSFTKEECENFPELYKYCFRVLRLYTPWDLGDELGDNIYRLRVYSVDIRDYEDKKEEILSLSGNEDKKDIPWLKLWDYETLASEVVNAGYGDLDTYAYNEQEVMNLDEVKEILCSIGIYIE